MNLEKIKPWNWFKKEEGTSLPVNKEASSFQSMMNLRNEIDNLFNSGSLFGNFPSRFGSFSDDFNKLSQSILRPKVDIAESKEQYHITIEIPGIDEKDISLHLDSDGILTIKGEKTLENKKEDKEWHSIERSYGSFQRVLALPEDSDQSLIDANFKNGVLSIDVGRKSTNSPSSVKRIEIQSN